MSMLVGIPTLQKTNIAPLQVAGKMNIPLLRWDMDSFPDSVTENGSIDAYKTNMMM